jgi:D-arabinose 5-phosphate isomerase GutQ
MNEMMAREIDCVILSSISGGTKRTVEAARIAKIASARIIAITCNTESALANAADETMLLPYHPLSRKTPHTLDYTVTLLALVELARSFAGKPRRCGKAGARRHPAGAFLSQAGRGTGLLGL